MSERFFVESPIRGEVGELTGSEAQHLVRVLRAQVGDPVTLFDGSGAEFQGEIADIHRAAVHVHDLRRCEIDRELPFSLTLAVALPKGDRQRWLVEKLTELGVTRLVPMISCRSIVQPDSGALPRLNRSVIEASKQCGRNRLMQIDSPQRWGHLVAQASSSALRLVAHPRHSQSSSESQRSGRLPERGDRNVFVAIGPEGGFTDDEVHMARAAGWQIVQLGPRVLRVDTAAVAIAAALTLRS